MVVFFFFIHYSCKVVVVGQGGCIGAKWLYLGRRGCIWAN